MNIHLRTLAACIALAAAAAADGPVLVVNAASPVNELTQQQAIDILSGERRDWDAGGKITLILPRDNAPEMAVLLEKVYKTDADGLKKHWTTMVFQNRLPAPPRTASGRVMVKLIEDDNNAVGVIPGKALTDGVKAPKIDGKGPDDPGYLLR